MSRTKSGSSRILGSDKSVVVNTLGVTGQPKFPFTALEYQLTAWRLPSGGHPWDVSHEKK